MEYKHNSEAQITRSPAEITRGRSSRRSSHVGQKITQKNKDNMDQHDT